MKIEELKDAAGQTTPSPGAAEPLSDDAAITAKKDRIRVLWAEYLTIRACKKKNYYELGQALDELHVMRAHHGDGTYDADVKAFGISKSTAWRVRNLYREVAGLAPVPEFVSIETNFTAGTAASPTNTVLEDVRSALINEGFKRTDVAKIVFDAAWDFAEAYRNAHGQLRAGVSGATVPVPAAATQGVGVGRSAADTMRDRASKKKKITQVRLESSRHETFHQSLAKWRAALGTENVSETIFQIVTTCEVPSCAK
jgi:hypothetical protein